MHHLILYAILLQLSIGLRHGGGFSHRVDVLCVAWQVNQRIYDLSVNTLTYIRSMFQQKKGEGTFFAVATFSKTVRYLPK